MSTTHSIQSCLKLAVLRLLDTSDSAQLDAELILAHCLDKNITYLHTWPERELTEEQFTAFNSFITQRMTDYPVAYILGKKPFWSFDLMVTPDVLIPRPETELLVETALEKIKDIKKPRILDLGTGSGAIALALASERRDAHIIAVDQSDAALNIAKRNSQALTLDKQVSFRCSNWFEQITEKEFDLIVSNPPYIDPEDEHLTGTIRHEPLTALIAPQKGMDDIEKIIKKSHPFMKKGGWLILEHGFDQAKKTAKLLSDRDYIEINNIKDLNNNWRITYASK